MPRVYNCNKRGFPHDAVWIDRRTRFGNQFKIGDWWAAKKRRMTRDDVCDRFEAEQLPGMNVETLRGKDLVCHCKPLRCHGDSILRKANQ